MAVLASWKIEVNICLFDSKANGNVELLSQQSHFFGIMLHINVRDTHLLQVWNGITFAAGADSLSCVLFAHWSRPMPEWLDFMLVLGQLISHDMAGMASG